jgi:hypothetical protein
MSANWLTTASNEPSVNGRSSASPRPPIDRGLQAPRHGEHVVVEIEAGHRPGGTDAGERTAREDAGAAGDVQDPVARPDLRDLGHDRRPLGEQGGDEVPLVGDGGAVGQLPGILVGHGCALRCG